VLLLFLILDAWG
jgi:hypothetical protein